VKADWDSLSSHDKKETATKIMLFGPETGYKQIIFVNLTGEEVAKVTDKNVEILK
jgi:hypothetical protein